VGMLKELLDRMDQRTRRLLGAGTALNGHRSVRPDPGSPRMWFLPACVSDRYRSLPTERVRLQEEP
jgi:hypothetical protein